MSKQTKRFYEFDRFRIDTAERVLMCGGEPAPLTQKSFELLLALVERAGRIVTKEELMEIVWPDTFVEESNLTQNIYTLRKTLGQTPDGKGYIETVPRRGYRFMAVVREITDGADPANTTETAPESVAETISSEPDHPAAGQSGGFLSPGRRRATFIAASIVGLAAVAGMLWLGGAKKLLTGIEADPEEMTITALTTAGNIATAAISPDGAYVAYATNDKADQSTLWIEQLSTSTRRAVIPSSQIRYYALTFTRDGSHIYYVAATNEQPLRSVYRVSVLGGLSKKLVENINAAVSFSPDGSRMALRRAVDKRRSIILAIAGVDGGPEKEIASITYPEVFYDPAWSPDGRVIACAAGDPDSVMGMSVLGVNVEDGAGKTISNRRWEWVGQMGWLADSRRLVMVAQENSASPRQIWLLDYSSGEARRLTNDTNVYNRLSLAAQPGVIAALQIKKVSNVWLLPEGDGARARQITFAAGGYVGGLSWTPDGRIVYDSEAGVSPAISIMDADGGNSKLLTGELSGRGYLSQSHVTPDGRHILFTSDLNGERHIWRMKIDGSDPVQLTRGTGEDDPSCTPDGRWVLYTRLERKNVGLPSIGRVSVEGGELKLLTDDFTAYPAVSPDGRSFACLYAPGPGMIPWNIAVYPIEGGRPLKIFKHPIQSQTVRWTPDGRGLTWAENPVSGPSRILFQPLEGGDPAPLAEFDTDRIFGLEWSRDGRRLACVRGLWATNVVLIKYSSRSF